MIRRKSESGFSLIETLMVVALIGVVSAIAVPLFGNMLGNFRVTGDARGLSNSLAVTKMRAAANFTRVRLYVDLAGRQYYVQTWDKTSPTCCWITEGGTTYLSSGVDFGFDVVPAPPPNTTALIEQADLCKMDDGTDIAGTACIMFNSRGVPINPANFAPTIEALYITDGQAVYAVTVAATGMLKSWRTFATTTPNWVTN